MEDHKRADALQPGNRVATEEDETAEILAVDEGIREDPVLVTDRRLASGERAACCVAFREEIVVIP